MLTATLLTASRPSTVNEREKNRDRESEAMSVMPFIRRSSHWLTRSQTWNGIYRENDREKIHKDKDDVEDDRLLATSLSQTSTKKCLCTWRAMHKKEKIGVISKSDIENRRWSFRLLLEFLAKKNTFHSIAVLHLNPLYEWEREN